MASLYSQDPRHFGKDVWEDGFNDQLEHALGSLYSKLQKSSKDVEGRDTFIKIKVGTSLGQGNIREGGDFRRARNSKWNEVRVELAELTHVIEYTNREWSLLNSSRAAAAPIMEEKMEDAAQVMERDIIFQTWSDGSAIRGRVDGVPTDENVSIKTVDGSAGGANQYDRDAFNWLEPGRVLVDLVNPTTGVVSVAEAEIVGRTDANGLVTEIELDKSASGAADGDVIVRSGNAWSNGGVYESLEFAGVMAMLQTGNVYLNLDRSDAANWIWRAVVQQGATPGTNEDLEILAIRSLINAVHNNGGRRPLPGTGYEFFSNLGVQAAYGEKAFNPVRYNNDSALDHGWQTLEFDGMLWHGDIHAPHNNLCLLACDEIEYRRPKYERGGTFRFFDMDGSIYRMRTGTNTGRYSAAVQSHLLGMLGLVTEQPNIQGRRDDFNEVAV